MGALNRERWERYKAEILSRLDYTSVYRGIRSTKPSGDGHLVGLCPFHEDHSPSFGFSTKDGTWKCFAGCGSGDVFEFLMRRDEKDFRDVLLDLGDQHGVPRPGGDTSAATTYNYRDEDGKLLYQVLRSPGKGFWVRRPNGSSGWVNSIKGVRRVLYRLPELLARPDETVFVVEGEKDVDRLHAVGLLATTNSGGAGKWKTSYSECLRGRDVVILPDNDAPGRDHAARIAKSLQGIAESIRIVELPDLPEKGDVSNWFDAGHTVDELQALVAEIEAWIPAEDDSTSPLRPAIKVNARQMHEICDETWKILLAQNDPPTLFVSSGRLSRIIAGDSGPVIQLLDESAAYGVLVYAADWVRISGGNVTHAKPLKDVARHILSSPHIDLPKLQAVVCTPVFGQNKKLIATAGYHGQEQLWLHLPADAIPACVPVPPTEAQVEAALALLREDLLVDFPFTEDSDEAHALAAVILPFVRYIIEGPTPIHLIEAPVPGSGKSLLAELICILFLGEAGGSTTLTKQEDENRKKLTAMLSQGGAIISIDNIQGGLESAQIASAITATKWKDRILGKTQMVEFPNRALWLVSANNPKLSLEIARRCVRIRLDPVEERPWERTSFKHDPIRQWVQEHRSELVTAVLTLVQSWVDAGCPIGKNKLGSFESWAAVVGGILSHVGVHGFLDDADEFYAEADTESKEWEAFVLAWYEKFSSAPVGVKDLHALAIDSDLIPFATVGKSEQAQKAKLGKSMNMIRGRRFGDLKVEMSLDAHTKVRQYRLTAQSTELFSSEEVGI